MSEQDFLKVVQSPIGLAALGWFFHSRLSKVEARLEAMALHIGAPTPQKERKLPVALLMLSGLAVLLACSGCSSGSLAKVARELKDDPATVSVKINTIYGTAHFTRVGGQTNSVSVSPDGTITINKP